MTRRNHFVNSRRRHDTGSNRLDRKKRENVRRCFQIMVSKKM